MDSNTKSERPQNPRVNANIFETLTFSWMIKLFKTGRNRDLNEKDLYAPLSDQTSSLLANELEKKWKIELVHACKKNRKPSFLRALINMFGAKYMFYGFLLCINEVVLKISLPLFLGGLLTYFNPGATENTDIRCYAYMCASGLVLSMLISVFLLHSVEFMISNCAMKMRVACSSIIFRKALRLSQTALGDTTVGQVINLLSNDVNRFHNGLYLSQYIWIGPLQTIVTTYFVWQEIGVSSLFGIAILLIVVLSQGYLGKKLFQIRLKTARWTDERGRLLNEIISGIEVIKMYTWEKPFEKLIEYARKKEIRHIRGINTVQAISYLYRVFVMRFQLFASVLCYVLLGNHITIQKVFIIISFYNLLYLTMTVFFCMGMTKMADILATVKRIQNFLLLEERDTAIANRTKCIPDLVNTLTGSNGINDTESSEKRSVNVGIDISNATAMWKEGQNSNTLDKINLSVRPGQMSTIIGHVGAGKSSILQLILRELPLSEGRVSVRGVVSYAPQEPWLFPGSVRENILFDSPMDMERYKQVIESCGLEQDFELFPDGDRTIVGERGVTLSGGQKSRINLARAIYKDADIYLLDDPLSAVDSRVGNHLFEKCIKGYLRDKITVLVTHKIQFLKDEEHIVIMENGKISAKCSYQELLTSDIDIAKLFGASEEDTVIAEPCIEPTVMSSDSVSLAGSKGRNEPYESESHEDKQKPNKVDETRSSGNISKRVFMAYISAFGSSLNIFIFFSMYVITQVLTGAVDFWITIWVNKEDYELVNSNDTSTNNTSTNLNDTMSSANYRQTCITVLAALNILLIIAVSIRSAIFVIVCTRASFNLHSMMLNAVIRAKMLFFHKNSSGRILNRFSNDIEAIDEQLPCLLLHMFQMGFTLLGAICILGIVDIYLLIPTIILGVISYYMRSFYLSTSRSIKRLEGVARSPVLGHMTASVHGLTTIRACKAEQTVYNEFDRHQDSHSSAWYLFISSNHAFGFWMEFIGTVYFGLIIFNFLIFSQYTRGGYVGLVITQALNPISFLHVILTQSTMVENQMTSVERVLEYANCPQEDNSKRSNKTVPKDWPDSGNIVINNFNLRYSPNSPYVLKNLNIQIGSMEKIGIVGRTGAGKSSIIKALFRLAVNEGEIFIDEFEIHQLSLHDLRSKLSVIPQEPVLYSGTIRRNLDPFDEFPDHVLWNALDQVQLKATIENSPGGLNSKISESGSNFSVGQKQLICLARALMRNNRILILDEATANIDAQTDVLIQETIRRKFQTCTVIVVAHRLNTVMDSDRVLVMDAGSAVEFDHPHVLLQNKHGHFYALVEQTGPTTSNLIHNVAAQNFKTMHEKQS